jgi:predicted SprT family Zn-dependent metalloprotease
MVNVRETVRELEDIWDVSLKEWEIVFEPTLRSSTLGTTNVEWKVIRITPHPSHSPEFIRIILVHELAHACDWIRSDEKKRLKHGKWQMHDKVFRGILEEIDCVHPDWVQDLKRLTVLERKKVKK